MTPYKFIQFNLRNKNPKINKNLNDTSNNILRVTKNEIEANYWCSSCYENTYILVDIDMI